MARLFRCALARSGRVRTGVGGQKATIISERVVGLLVRYYTKTVKNLPRGHRAPALGAMFVQCRRHGRGFRSRTARSICLCGRTTEQSLGLRH